MSIRIRETYGTSWPGTAPGTRRYRSTSVSFGLGTYLAWCSARGMLGLFTLPFALMWWCLLLELWVFAEFLLFTVTGIAVITAVLRGRGRAVDITFMRAPWHLYVFGLRGAGQ